MAAIDPLFKKLNYKSQPEILVLNHPESVNAHVEAMAGIAKLYFDHQELQSIIFALIFVTKQKEIDELVPQLVPRLEGDAIMWFSYPKGSSKKYRCDFNRDTGWQVMGKYDLEPVRQVAIDEDWSALRFRKVEYIKKITRRESFALSAKARERTTKKGE